MDKTNLPYLTLNDQPVAKHQLMEGILDLLPGYIFWKDTQSVYLGCNLNFAELVGLKQPDDIVGKTDIDLLWRDQKNRPIMIFNRWDEAVIDIDEELELNDEV